MTAHTLATRKPLTRAAVLAFAAALSLTFVAMRAMGTLGPPGLRWILPLGFVVMGALPWLMLTREGRKQIGLRLPHDPRFFLIGVVAGAGAAALCFAVGMALYGTSPDNWYVSIANSYRKVMNTDGFGPLMLHLIFTIPACIFSPLGEELFFRGFLQGALETRFSARASTHIEAALFGLVHLCHHGLIVTAAGAHMRVGSGALWVALMFGTAWMFAWLRQRSDSLGPAIVSHAAFNATMNVFIFAVLWNPPGA
jgi:membrane protease YdiL (CAAX protease family)